MIKKSGGKYYAATKKGKHLSKKGKSREAALAQLRALEASKAARKRGAGAPAHAEESPTRQIQKTLPTKRKNFSIEDWEKQLKNKRVKK